MDAVDVLLGMARELVEQVERMKWPGERLAPWYEGRLVGFEVAAIRLSAGRVRGLGAEFDALHARCRAAFDASRKRAESMASAG